MTILKRFLKKTACATLVLAAVLPVTGCHKIYFHSTADRDTTVATGEWHHIGIFDLVEFSPPVEMGKRCDGRKWSTVKTSRPFVQGLVHAVTYGLYGPLEVAYECG